jgi:hypothetical protein
MPAAQLTDRHNCPMVTGVVSKPSAREGKVIGPPRFFFRAMAGRRSESSKTAGKNGSPERDCGGPAPELQWFIVE